MANKYIDLLLVRPEDVVPVLVEAPISVASEGNIVFFTEEDNGTVIRSEWLDSGSVLYAMISEISMGLSSQTAIRIFSRSSLL